VVICIWTTQLFLQPSLVVWSCEWKQNSVWLFCSHSERYFTTPTPYCAYRF